MNPIFKKLNFKNHNPIVILHAPGTFGPALDEMRDLTRVVTSLPAGEEISFFLAFVSEQKLVDSLATSIVPLLQDEAVFWFAYPKATSRKYKCDFNRDTGWIALGELGFEGVRMVAIDEDWSALRFKRAENIKTMTRRFAMSDTGKKKVASQSKSGKHSAS